MRIEINACEGVEELVNPIYFLFFISVGIKISYVRAIESLVRIRRRRLGLLPFFCAKLTAERTIEKQINTFFMVLIVV